MYSYILMGNVVSELGLCYFLNFSPMIMLAGAPTAVTMVAPAAVAAARSTADIPPFPLLLLLPLRSCIGLSIECLI